MQTERDTDEAILELIATDGPHTGAIYAKATMVAGRWQMEVLDSAIYRAQLHPDLEGGHDDRH